MRCSLLPICMWCALTFALSPAWGEEESLETRRSRLQSMTAAQKEELRRKQERFARLSKEERDRLRNLHDQICDETDANQLRLVMLRYSEWLKSLPSARRMDLASLPPDQRITEIRKLVEQQEKQRFEELVLKTLRPEDYQTILEWFHNVVEHHESDMLAALSPEDRERVQQQQEPHRRRMQLLYLYRQKIGDRSQPLLETLPVSEEEIQRLAKDLSPEAKRAIDEADDADAKTTMVGNWVNAATYSRMFFPQVSSEALQEFLEKHVDDALRDRLENMPRERMLSELRRMYYVHRFRGSANDPGRRGGFRKRRPGEFRMAPDGFRGEGGRKDEPGTSGREKTDDDAP